MQIESTVRTVFVDEVLEDFGVPGSGNLAGMFVVIILGRQRATKDKTSHNLRFTQEN